MSSTVISSVPGFLVTTSVLPPSSQSLSNTVPIIPTEFSDAGDAAFDEKTVTSFIEITTTTRITSPSATSTPLATILPPPPGLTQTASSRIVVEYSSARELQTRTYLPQETIWNNRDFWEGPNPTTTTVGTTPTTIPSSKWPRATKIGVGVGVPLAVLLTAALLAWGFLERRRRVAALQGRKDGFERQVEIVPVGELEGEGVQKELPAT